MQQKSIQKEDSTVSSGLDNKDLAILKLLHGQCPGYGQRNS